MLTVPVATLDTGIPLRDEHLRGKDWFDAAAHPEITLTIEKIENVRTVKSGDGFQTFDLTVIGTLSIRGVTRQVRVPGRITYLEENEKTAQAMPGDLLAVRASFGVRLADYGITGPKGAGLIGSKVGENVTIDVSFRASTVGPELAGNPCGGKDDH